MSFWPTEGPLPILIASKDDMKRYEMYWNMHRWMQYEDFHVGILHGWWSWSEVLSGWDPRLATHVLGGLAKAQTQGLTGAGWKQIWKTNDMNWFFRKKIMKYDLYKYMLYIIVPFWTVNVDGNILQFFFKSFLQKALSYDQFSPRYRSSTKSSLKVILLHIPIYSQLEDHWNLDIEENCFWRPKTFVCRVAFYVLYYSECWGQTWHNFVECPRTFGRKNTC